MDSVSVVIFFKNEEKYILDALDSVLNQTVQPDEVVLVDDHSTDNSVKILKKYIDSLDFENISLIKNNGKGKVQAYQTGLETAKSEWFCVCAGDDVLLESYIEDNLSFLKKEKADYCLNSFYVCDEKLQIIDRSISTDFNPEEIYFRNVASGYIFCRMSLINTVLPFPKQLEFEDWYTNIMLYDSCGYLIRNGKPLFYYRRHSNASTATNNDYKIIKKLYERDLRVLKLLLQNERLSKNSKDKLMLSYELRLANLTKLLDFKYIKKMLSFFLCNVPVKYICRSIGRYGKVVISRFATLSPF